MSIVIPRVSQIRTFVPTPASHDRQLDADMIRPQVHGKFLYVGDTKFLVRGVTYGAFRPNEREEEYFDLAVIERDFAEMAAAGINTVRIPHTLPPRTLLDIAHRHGLLVMVGLSAEQYVGYLIDRKGAPNVARLIRQKVLAVAGHPALLCYALGNEISPQLVRWLGAKQIERYLERLYRVVKRADPGGLVTYVNFPTSEYLHLPFLDLISFNVYLEQPAQLQAYLARLHSIAVDRPLILSEVGLDSLRNGLTNQAQVLDWQIRLAFAAGCAGTIVFSWTDEWYRAGEDVRDWAFGLTNEYRQPKPALMAVKRAYEEAPFSDQRHWPRVSVVVCTYNGSRTIKDCLDGLRDLDYPNFEVIVIDDGSRDNTTEIVRGYDVKLISTENRGLSAARNTGWQAATGEIVAYIDDDAYPDPHWLQYLAQVFVGSDCAAAGGPNLAPAGDGAIAECVAQAPGGPTHVLLSDSEAEHIPGCNMAFRREALAAVGGFDPRYRVAGDDVDMCWKILQRGWKIAFHAGALVWHHRRNSIRAYWRQQRGYGIAEALLETQWPEKYNRAGHLMWRGRVYTTATNCLLLPRSRIYHGVWGLAPFQRLYQPGPGLLGSLPLTPEWYVFTFMVALLTLLGLVWPQMFWGVPVLALCAGASLMQACRAAFTARFPPSRGWVGRRLVTAALYLIQPLARYLGRASVGLVPWRQRGVRRFVLPFTRKLAFLQRGPWRTPEQVLLGMEQHFRERRLTVQRGMDFDDWDLEAHGGLLGSVRVTLAIEDHGPTTQLLRLLIRPVIPWPAVTSILVLAALACAAFWFGRSWGATAVLAAMSMLMLGRTVDEVGSSLAGVLDVSKAPLDDETTWN